MWVRSLTKTAGESQKITVNQREEIHKVISSDLIQSLPKYRRS